MVFFDFLRDHQIEEPKFIDKFVILRLTVLNLMSDINKENLVEIIKGLLGTDADLNFLVKVDENELETLVARIRDRIEQVRK